MAKKRGGATNATTGKNRGGATKAPNSRKTKIGAKQPKNMPRTALPGAGGTLTQADVYRLDGVSALGKLTKNQAQGGGAMPKGQS